MKVYKYTRLEFIESSIENGIYASRLDQVNDPYEEEGIVNCDDYRICCVSLSSRQMLLWSYYNQHYGCTIQFEVPDGSFVPVEYTETFETRRYSNASEIKTSLLQKGKEWEHEKEYRAVYYSKDIDNSMWRIVGDNFFYDDATVTRVTFGALAYKSEHYMAAINYLIEYNKTATKKIEVKKLILRNDRYELVNDNQFDYLDEGKKLSH